MTEVLQTALLVPLPATAIALAGRSAIRCLTLLIGLLITTHGAPIEQRAQAFTELARALTPPRASMSRLPRG